MRRSDWIILALFFAIVVFSHNHLGSLSIDGIRYARIAQHILMDQRWYPLYDEVDEGMYVNKPPILFWLIALSFKVFGISTFSARLPTLFIVFLSLILLVSSFKKLFGEKVAIFTALLVIANAHFFRGIGNLGFEGFILAGSTLLFSETVRSLRGEQWNLKRGLTSALGILCFVISKFTELALILPPIAIALFQFSGIKSRPPFRAILSGLAGGVLMLAAAVYFLGGTDYLLGALHNQIITPLTLTSSYAANFKRWLVTFFAYYAPASILGVFFLLKFGRPESLAPNEFRFLLITFLFSLPVMFLTQNRAPYLFIGMFALIVITAHHGALIIKHASVSKISKILAAASLVLFTAFATGVVEPRLFHPLTEFFHNDPKLLEEKYVLCTNAADPNFRKRTQMTFAFEFGHNPRIFNASDIHRSSGYNTIVADKYCAEDLVKIRHDMEVVSSTSRGKQFSFSKKASSKEILPDS